jgi:hypothetical protein
LACQVRQRPVLACVGRGRGGLEGTRRVVAARLVRPDGVHSGSQLHRLERGAGAFVGPNPDKVRDTYHKLGVPVPGERVDVEQIGMDLVGDCG